MLFSDASGLALWDNLPAGAGLWSPSGLSMYNTNLSGNIGIGTVSPSEKLDVVGKIKTTDLQISNGAGANKILSSDVSGNASWVTSSSVVNWSLNGSNIYNNNGGNVGIGLINPTEKFQVDGNLKLGNFGNWGTSGDRVIKFGDGDFITIGERFSDDQLHVKGNSGIIFRTNGDLEQMRLNFNGNLGIGTATPTNKLSVTGNADITGNVGIGIANPTTAKLVFGGSAGQEGIDLASADQYANMRVIRNNLFGPDKDMFIGFGSGANSSLHLYSNNIETITAKNSNVGIGNSDPAYLLDISKRIRLRSESATFGAGIWFNKNDNSSENIFLGNDVSNNLQVYSLIGSRTIASFNPSTGGFRVEGPVAASSGNFIASFGGNGDFVIDKPGQIGGRLTIKENGAIAVGGAANTGTAGQVLTSNGGGSSPKWQNPIVQSANTFPGYTNPTAITSTAITDIIGSVLTITTPIGVTTRLFYSCDFELVSNGCTGFNCSPNFSFQLMVDGVVKQLKSSTINASDSRQVAFSNVAVDVSGGSHTIKIVVNKFDDENNCNVYLQNASVFALPQ